MHRTLSGWAVLGVLLTMSLASYSQTSFHIHKETASGSYYLLSTSGPDSTSTTLTTPDLKSITGTTWIANWASGLGVPNSAGTVPANSNFQFSLWVKKSANYGTIYPVVTFGKLGSNGVATPWGTVVATTALTTTLTKVTISASTVGSQTMTATDRWWVEVGAYIPSGGSANKSVTASLNFEGTLNGNYDSTVILPNIQQPTLTSISISPLNRSLPLGLTTQLTATGNFSDGSTQDFTKTATWNSSQSTVASISSTGVVTTQSQGTVTITATSATVSGSTTLHVLAPSLLNVAISPGNIVLPAGITQQMTAVANYSNGSSQDVTAVAAWNSSLPETASVNSSGVVTGISSGTATISATVNGLAFPSIVTVPPPGPPTIMASVSPAPNAAGWNNSSVTVAFTCTPGSAPIISCPVPQVVSSEGSGQVVSGTVTDSLGNSATASVILNIDRTPPVLVLNAPADESTINTSPTFADGTLVDELSGLASLTCNGAPVTISGSFSCNIALHAGRNLVAVRAADIAGNVALVAVHVTYPTYPAPTKITITPTNVNLAVGQTQQFTAIDSYGYPRPDATWTLPNRTTLASITVGSSPVLTAKAVGQVVLTTTVQGISAQTTINIVSSIGSSNWTVPSLTGVSVTNSGYGVPFATAVPNSDGVALIAHESAPSSGNGINFIRALTMDGQQLWQQSLPAYSVLDALGLDGGVIIRTPQPNANLISYWDRQTGSQLWSVDIPGYTGSVRSNGSAVVSSDTGVSLLSQATGQTISIPFPDVTTVVDTFAGGSCGTGFTTTRQGAPSYFGKTTADTEGNAYIEYVVQDGKGTGHLEPAQNCNPVLDNNVVKYKLVLMTIFADGSTSTTELAQRTVTQTGDGSSGSLVLPGTVTPDGQGGVLANWMEESPFTPSHYMVTHLSANGQSDFYLPALDNMEPAGGYVPGTVVLNSNGTGFVVGVTSAPSSTFVAFDVNSGQQLWTVTLGIGVAGLPSMFALDDGGLLVKGSDLTNQRMYVIDSSGNVGPSFITDWLVTDDWGGAWLSVGLSGGISSINLPYVLDQASPWPESFGNPSQSMFGVPGCPCLTQTADNGLVSAAPVTPQSGAGSVQASSELLSASAPPDCPICNLPQPPPSTCVTMQGSGALYLILVGDPGLTPHDLHYYLDLAAQQKANQLNAAGNKVIACRISSVADFHARLTGSGFITGGVFYFGHSGPFELRTDAQILGVASILMVGQATGFDTTDIGAHNVQQLCDPTAGCDINNYLATSATITLIGCQPAADVFDYSAQRKTSIAKLIAKQLGRPVYAWKVGMYMSQLDRYHDPLFAPNKKTPLPPQTLPMYFVPVGQPGQKPDPVVCQPSGNCTKAQANPYEE